MFMIDTNPEGAVGHRRSAVTVPNRKRIIKQFQLKFKKYLGHGNYLSSNVALLIGTNLCYFWLMEQQEGLTLSWLQGI